MTAGTPATVKLRCKSCQTVFTAVRGGPIVCPACGAVGGAKPSAPVGGSIPHPFSETTSGSEVVLQLSSTPVLPPLTAPLPGNRQAPPSRPSNGLDDRTPPAPRQRSGVRQAVGLDKPTTPAQRSVSSGDTQTPRAGAGTAGAGTAGAASAMEAPAGVPLPEAVANMLNDAKQMVGRTIDNFRLDSKLGGGAMGVVYKAVDANLGRPVAVKFMTSVRDKARARFQREARLAAALKHPNIVPVFHFGEHQNIPYLVTEWVPGGSLGQMVTKTGPMPVDKAVRFIRDAARGLQIAHNANIVHRDIKPDNLLIDDRGICKVADFGLAKETDDMQHLTKTGMVVGSVPFLAPEVCRGGDPTPAGDIYALGCTLYYLVTGQTPFGVQPMGDVILKHVLQPFPNAKTIKPNLPAKFDAILQQTCAKDPARRFANADKFADELDEFLISIGAEQPKTGPSSNRNAAVSRSREEKPEPPRPPIDLSTSTDTLSNGAKPPTRNPNDLPPGLLVIGGALLVGMLLIALAILFRAF